MVEDVWMSGRVILISKRVRKKGWIKLRLRLHDVDDTSGLLRETGLFAYS